MGYSPSGRKELDMTEHTHTHTHTDDYRELKAWFLVPNMSPFLPTVDLGKLLNLT